jgi:pimeloyl-ACP methyl ester carboxylesterase
LEETLVDAYTLLTIDLPFHGKTIWNEGHTLAQLLQIVEEILKDQNIKQDKLQLAGYSTGGRLALSLLELVPGKIEKIFLFSPDGLVMNGWYWLAMHNRLGNRLFEYTMHHPGWFFRMMDLTRRIGLSNRSVHKFAKSSIEKPEERELLYKRWTCMAPSRPDLKKIKSLILAHPIFVELIYGRFDRIIRYSRGEEFRKGIETHSRLTILDAGHQLLQARWLDQIIPLFDRSMNHSDH